MKKPEKNKLTHLDSKGRAAMVDVSPKHSTERLASAEAIVTLSKATFDLIKSGNVKKGDVHAVARLAGIMAGKKTSDLIPLCHPLALSFIGIEIETLEKQKALRLIATAKTTGPTGVEMEAMTAVSIAALTIYDMVKAVDRGTQIQSIRLLTKSGGKSGTYKAKP